MKKILLLAIMSITTLLMQSQTLDTNGTNNWDTLRKSGFYESTTGTPNLPDNTFDYYWGINMAHSSNSYTTSPYYWGGQILIGINRSNQPPSMYIRSTNQEGSGMWAKVLHNKGMQTIQGALTIHGNINEDIPTSQIHLVDGNGLWIQSATAQLKMSDITGTMIFKMNNKGDLLLASNVKENLYSFDKLGNFEVNGTIRTKEIKVEATGWADYVFNKEYKLPSLAEVESHIIDHKCLPDIPTEEQVRKEGINLAEMQAKLLQKIEELTLYVIDQDKTIKEQSRLIENLQDRFEIKK